MMLLSYINNGDDEELIDELNVNAKWISQEINIEKSKIITNLYTDSNALIMQKIYIEMNLSK